MTEILGKKPMMTGMTSSIMLILMVAFLIFAVINWQTFQWYEFVWLGMFILSFIIRLPFSTKTNKNAIVKNNNDGIEMTLLIAMFLTTSIFPLFVLGSPGGLFEFANYQLPVWAPVLGTLFVLPYCWLFWRSHADLGRNWSPGLEVHKEHKLITRGVYAKMRHPMYCAIWLMVIIQPLLIQNWIGGWLVVPAFLIMYLIRVPKEEQLMKEQFGTEYENYIKRSWRIIPKFV